MPGGGVPTDIDEYCSVTKDRAPPLFPSGPRWIYDDELRKRLMPTGMDLHAWLLDSYTNQRKLDACWRCFGGACDALPEDERRDMRAWYDDVVKPTGWQLPHNSRILKMGSITRGQLVETIGTAMQRGELTMRPSSKPPTDVLGKCDECDAPCTSECICGESFCSRACLLKNWPSHQHICARVLEQAEMGAMLTYIEKASGKFDTSVDVRQCLGFSPWKGGLLPGRSTATPSPASATGPEALVGARVVLSGLVGRAELNGRAGRAVGWDAARGRLAVAVDGGEQLAVKPSNVEREGATRCAECGKTVPSERYAAEQLAKGPARRCRPCLAALTPPQKELLDKFEQQLAVSGPDQQAVRDFTMMRLCQPVSAKTGFGAIGDEQARAVPTVHPDIATGIETARSPRQREALAAWSVALAYERGVPEAELRSAGVEAPISDEQAVRSAALAMLIDHSAVRSPPLRTIAPSHPHAFPHTLTPYAVHRPPHCAVRRADGTRRRHNEESAGHRGVSDLEGER